MGRQRSQSIANNRYYSNACGRFMTPDPSTANVDRKNPQSWNFYAYVNGDPVNDNDPFGLRDVIIGGITQNRNNAPDVEGYGNGAISMSPDSQHSNTSSLLSSRDSHFAGVAESCGAVPHRANEHVRGGYRSIVSSSRWKADQRNDV